MSDRTICSMRHALGLVLLAVGMGASARAADVACVLQASDWASGDAATGPLASGTYEVLVWAASGDGWAAEVDGKRVQLKPGPNAPSRDEKPGWRTLAEVLLFDGDALTFALPAPPSKPLKKGEKPQPRCAPVLLWVRQKEAAPPADLLDVIRGKTDRPVPVADARRSTIRTNQQGADFRAPKSLQAWTDRAAYLRDQLRVTLGLWPMPPRGPLNAQVWGTIDRGDYTIDRFMIETLPGVWLSGNLYRPKPLEGRRPAILCPHGHWEDGRVSQEVQPRCVRLAKLGFVAVLYDMVGYNDSKPFGHAFLNDHLERWGFSLATLQTWNSLRLVDWLTERPDVDPARIGCTGESGGGTQTFLLAALDPRVVAPAPVVMVSEWFQGGCVCENAAGLRHGTDNVEFAALAAPRPMKLIGATGDWTAHTTSHTLPVLRDVYNLFGAGGRVEAEVFSFPHNYNQTSRNAVYPFMTRVLMGYDDPERTREGEQTLEKPEDLWTTTAEHPAPGNTRTPNQLEADLTQWLASEVELARPGSNPAAAVRLEALRRAHQIRLGIDRDAVLPYSAVEVRKVDRPGMRIVHGAIKRQSDGGSVPTVLIVPERRTGIVTVVASAQGKRGLVAPDGRVQPLVARLLEAGHMVVGFDPFLVGESADPADLRPDRPHTDHYPTYNRTLPEDRALDLATVIDWAGTLPGARQRNLIAQQGFGPIALLALPQIPEIARSWIDLEGFDYGDGTGTVPPEFDMPGVLQVGGLPAAAALAAPRLLWIARPADARVADWALQGYRAAGSPQSVRVDARLPSAEVLVRWLNTSDFPAE